MTKDQVIQKIREIIAKDTRFQDLNVKVEFKDKK